VKWRKVGRVIIERMLHGLTGPLGADTLLDIFIQKSWHGFSSSWREVLPNDGESVSGIIRVVALGRIFFSSGTMFVLSDINWGRVILPALE
jgi:hypothetical protein